MKSLLRDHWRARYHSFHNKFEQPDDLDNEDDIENDKIRTIRESTNYIVRLITGANVFKLICYRYNLYNFRQSFGYDRK